jgi:class 3 adenylate cyclase
MMEVEGSGIPTAVSDCKECHAPEPTVELRDGYIMVTIYPCNDWDTAVDVAANAAIASKRSRVAKSDFNYLKLATPGRFLQRTVTILFIDIISFTRYGDNAAMKEAIRTLEATISDVLESLEWDIENDDNDAVMLPTTDGYGVAFSAEIHDGNILGYAAEISNKLKNRGMPVRIGINKGPCFVCKDLNGRLNLTGWGVVGAKQTVACGGKNHILCTATFAESVNQSRSDPNLHDIGSYKIRENRLHLFSYYQSRDFGNSIAPQQNKLHQRRKGVTT